MKYTKYIKWVLLILGAIRFRMFGAFAGYFIGIFVEEILEGNYSLLGGEDTRNKVSNFKMSAYQKKLLVLIAALLRTNSIISQQQSYYILKYFYRQFGTKNGKALFAILKELVQTPVEYMEEARSLSGTAREGKHQIIQFLYGLTNVDRPMHAGEKSVLENIAKGIGMSQYDFERIVRPQSKQKKTRTSYPSYSSGKAHYTTLGVSESATKEELKKAYRKLVLKFHPDKTSLSPELAAEKFQQVQEAYDYIRERKGIK